MDFSSLSVVELRAMAKEKKIKNVSAMKKQELVDALSSLEAKTPEAANEAVTKDTVEPKKAAVTREAKKEPLATVDKKEAALTQKETPTVADRSASNADPHKEALSELKRAANAIESNSAENRRPVNRYNDQNRGYNSNRGNDYRNNYQNRGNSQSNRSYQNYTSYNNQNGQTQTNSQTSQSQNGQTQTYSQTNQSQNGQTQTNSQTNQSQNGQTQTFSQASQSQNGQTQTYSQASQPQEGQQSSAVRRGGMWVYPDETYDLHNVLTPEMAQMDSNETKTGILEIMPDGFGFIRSANFLPGDDDVYVSPAQIRRLNLKTGDMISGNTRIKSGSEKFSALLYVKTVNGLHPSEAVKRPRFEDLTPVFPHDRIHLETPGCTPAMRIVDILSPIGKGQRGMIVSQPKAGKTTLLKQIATAITKNNPDMHLMILLIDERPEEVTDMKESIQGDNVEVIYSTFDELPENHKRVSEMVIGRAKRLVEHKKDVVILLDSITRLARAYNLTCASSGRTLSGGLDPAALHMPKKFFGAARCMREGGSLTVLATALVDTGSRMDDVVFEEFKGTGNMELVLDRNLSEKRIFPAIDLPKSSTRRDDLLLSPEEMEANDIIRHAFNSGKSGDAVEKIINMFAHTKNNEEFVQLVKKTRF